MRFRQGCLLIVALFVATNSMAAATWHTSTVKWVYATADGNFVLTFDTSSATCTNPNDYYYVIVGQNGVTAEGRDKMYALAIVAATAGKSVTINFDNSAVNCNINRLYAVY